MPLDEYKRKREFSRTPEPQGSRRNSGGVLTFVVQKHAARHLHYDFRLELDGVLKSWAVPKGPSLDPHDKRLAVQVEDHPLEYGSFEGTIPAGQYGAGKVEIWDHGTWTPDEDPRAGLREGKLSFVLHGRKLHGRWKLVLMHGRAASDGKPNWLLMKARDDDARPGQGDSKLDEPAVGAAATGKKGSQRRTSKASKTSAVSPRKGTPAHGAKSRGAAAISASISTVSGARRAALPAKIEPQLATLVAQAPTGNEWFHEIKLDGYRLICRIARGQVQLLTRRALDWTERFPTIARAVQDLHLDSAVLDGEAVVLEPNGGSNFQLLQTALSENTPGRVVYYVFDLLYLDGYDLRGMPLVERKQLLQRLLTERGASKHVRLCEYVEGNGPVFLRECCRHHLEGVIAKRRDQPYRAGRSTDWLKIKCTQHEEFVIGGFTDPGAARSGFGAILVGYFDQPGKLIYAGRVGTGFSTETLVSLRRMFDKLQQKTSPFVNLTASDASREVHWVRPQLVCQVEFTNWTRDHVLRHPSFQGLRDDLPASAVVRDAPVPGGLAEAKSDASRKKSRSAKASSARSTARHSVSRAGHPTKVSLGKTLEDAGAVEVAGVRLTHPDRVLFSDARITKLDLAHYYESIADWILPHIVDRPLSLLRCPAGCDKPCFFQKNLGPGAPPALDRMRISSQRTSTDFAVVRDLAGLVSLVQMGVLEIHPWGSRTDDIERPDRLTFDLDPDSGVPWADIIGTARRLRELLDDLKLASFLKTSGGKGLHVVVPIARRNTWDEAKEFSRSVVEFLARQFPDQYLTKASKAARRGKVYLDYLRNDRGATAVAPYSTRARAGAPVSTPLRWDELSTRIGPGYFHVGNVPHRLARLAHDPWADLQDARQSLAGAAKRLRTL